MTHLSGKERGEYVQNMFTRIAHHYDLMNRLMTAGQDIHWREQVIQRARLSPNARLLDLGREDPAGREPVGRDPP